MNLLNDGLLTTLDVAIKVALRHDPATLNRLASLDGKNLSVHLTAPDLQLYIQIVADGLEFSTLAPEQIDCSIEGSASDFIETVLDDQMRLAAGIEFRGETGIAISLQEIFRQLDLDWEGMLGDHIGDLAAHQLATMLRAGHSYLRDSRQILIADIDDYLHEEIRVLPHQLELERFYDQVDELRLKADRLQARVDRLARLTEQDAESSGENNR